MSNQRTQQPIVTGSTILGIKYSNGIMLASDTLASYGTLARYKNIQRINKIGDNILIGGSGEYSDYQLLIQKLNELYQEDINLDDGYYRSPNEIHQYLRAIMYQKRNKMNPLWNQLLIGGYKNNKSYLGYVDMIGTAYEENYIATGYGAYLAIPLIRERWNPDLEEGEARALLEDCLRVLWYRDCKASNKIQIAKSTAEGTIISDPYELEHDWQTANFDLRHSAPTDGSSW